MCPSVDMGAVDKIIKFPWRPFDRFSQQNKTTKQRNFAQNEHTHTQKKRQNTKTLSTQRERERERVVVKLLPSVQSFRIVAVVFVSLV